MNLHLEQPASKSHVVDHFCKLAVETTYCDVRDALLETLKDSADEASKRFIAYAMQASDPSVRRRALINLSLMGCYHAPKAVLQGLRDPSREVRIAAAFFAGFYDDEEVQDALEIFLRPILLMMLKKKC